MRYYVYLVIDKRNNKIRAEGDKKYCKHFLKSLGKEDRKNHKLIRV